MDDLLKPFGKREREIDYSCVNSSTTLRIEFGMEKCGVLIMKREKTSSTDGIRVMDEETIKEVTEEGYKYLKFLESNKVKGKETKDLFRKECFRRIRFVLNRS